MSKEYKCHHGSALIFPDHATGGHIWGCSLAKDGKNCPQFIEEPVTPEDFNIFKSKRFSDVPVPKEKSDTEWEHISAVRPPWLYGVDPEAPNYPSHEMMAPINGTTYTSVVQGSFPRYFITENSVKDILHWINRSGWKRVLLINLPEVHEAIQLMKWFGKYAGVDSYHEKHSERPDSVLFDADDRLFGYFDDVGYSQGCEVGGINPDPSKSKKARAERAKVAQRLGVEKVSHSSIVRFNSSNCELMQLRDQDELYNHDGQRDKSKGAEDLAAMQTQAHQEGYDRLCQLVAGCDGVIFGNPPGMRYEYVMQLIYKLSAIRNKMRNPGSNKTPPIIPLMFFASSQLAPRIHTESACLLKRLAPSYPQKTTFPGYSKLCTSTNPDPSAAPTLSETYAFDSKTKLLFGMADYPIHYVGNPFRVIKKRARGGNENSPMRIFTTENLMQVFTPPAGQEDRFQVCEKCDKYCRMQNQHCDACNACVSTDGTKRQHCHKCKTCVPFKFLHCDTCARCVPNDDWRPHKCQSKEEDEDEEEVKPGKEDTIDPAKKASVVLRNPFASKDASEAAAEDAAKAVESSTGPAGEVQKMSRRYKKTLAKKRKMEADAAGK